jgi:hypothetical protein
MTQPTRPWTLIAAFARADERDKCLAETEAALARATEASSAQIYRTEMSNGAPALGVEHPTKEALAPLLTHIASLYGVFSLSLYLGD